MVILREERALFIRSFASCDNQSIKEEGVFFLRLINHSVTNDVTCLRKHEYVA